eukprot:TRINITY_DN5203_c0_g1_i2.p1 TRINITY_DN5203_c0_g1~~TRINITY_DN5203_c0_g1_i2.p1  ORF type:complete len:216 (-),score=34.56 TRINITY_DN5203_c0_g1_i2:7-654(-)
MDELAQQVHDVVLHFKLNKVIAFGVGSGGHVLLNYAVRYPKFVLGIIGVNISCRRASWPEWFYFKAIIFNLKYNIRLDFCKEQLIDRYFSISTQQANVDQIEYHQMQLNNMNLSNVAKYIEAYMSRGDITSKISELNKPYMFFNSRDTYYDDEFEHLMYSVIPGKANIVEKFDRGVLLTEEDPEYMFEPLELFFNGLDIYFTRYINTHFSSSESD